MNLDRELNSRAGVLMSRERRSRVRWRTSYFFKDDKDYERDYFDVVDCNTEQSIGHLVDLTMDGMRVISKSPIPHDTTYDFRIDLPEKVKGNEKILVKAHCVWSDKDTNPDYFNAGFRILSITPPYVEIIEMLIGG
jgi:hypothetical protein